MSKIGERVELLANVAIIIAGLLVSIAFIDRVFIRPSAPFAPRETGSLKNGVKLPISDVNWSNKSKTLVMALSKTCRFCTESIPFYKKLSQIRSTREDINLVGVMPQSVEDAQSYFRDQNISVDAIRSTRLSDISVQGTPTLILVDENGVVIESWVGKLPPQREDEVVSHVFGDLANK
jgi:thioredoxin-related protein